MVSTAGGIVIAVVVILLAAAIGWVVFTQLRARRLGLPPPTLSSYIPFGQSSSPYGPPRPATGGVVGWVNDQVRKLKNRNNRSAVGSYEGSALHPGQGGGGRSGFGPLDPDEAWDARVGHEADGYGGYYEEQELSGRVGPADTSYGGSHARGTGDEEDQRGRGREYSGGEEMGPVASRNPFDDEAATSMRGLSPRPMDRRRSDSDDGSPQGRRSVFRENV